MIDKKSKKFLKEYLGSASPTGHETKGQELWLDYISPYVHEWHTDVYGTAYGVINPGKKYKVCLLYTSCIASKVWLFNLDMTFIWMIRGIQSPKLFILRPYTIV